MTARGQSSALISVLFMLPGIADAYMGPGAGLSMLGSLFAVSALGLATVVGLLFYPLVLLKERLRGPRDEAGTGGETESEAAAQTTDRHRDH